MLLSKNIFILWYLNKSGEEEIWCASKDGNYIRKQRGILLGGRTEFWITNEYTSSLHKFGLDEGDLIEH